MHAVPDNPHLREPHHKEWRGRHSWVGATLVGLGAGDTARAEHAARTGRHVLGTATKVEVLEVYCARCRVPYSARALRSSCTAMGARAAS